MAVALLLLGVALPLASAISQPRSEGRVAHAAELAALPTAVVQVRQPSLFDRIISPLPIATSTPAAGPAQPTLVPIVPTAAPAGEPAVPPPPAEPAPSALAPGVSGPILMYHYVRVVDGNLDPLGYDLSVAPELFEQQMAWMAQQGYSGVRLDLYLRCTGRLGAPAPGERCPDHPVALTFDDGYADAFDQALPVLRRYGFSATFYIVDNFVGQPGYMTWEQVLALRDEGMEIGSHTLDHMMLTRLDSGEMQRQIVQSKADLEQHLGMPIRSFSYPVGDYDWAVEEQVRSAGFENATSTRWDDNYSDVLGLPRRRVAGGTTVEELMWIVTS
jgi:peptidoglycan/xylan/chitin deacetylase (PgdA/CDA1 family)